MVQVPSVFERRAYPLRVRGPVGVGDVVYLPDGTDVLDTDASGTPYGRVREAIVSEAVVRVLVQVGTEE